MAGQFPAYVIAASLVPVDWGRFQPNKPADFTFS